MSADLTQRSAEQRRTLENNERELVLLRNGEQRARENHGRGEVETATPSRITELERQNCGIRAYLKQHCQAADPA